MRETLKVSIGVVVWGGSVPLPKRSGNWDARIVIKIMFFGAQSHAFGQFNNYAVITPNSPIHSYNLGFFQLQTEHDSMRSQ